MKDDDGGNMFKLLHGVKFQKTEILRNHRPGEPQNFKFKIVLNKRKLTRKWEGEKKNMFALFEERLYALWSQFPRRAPFCKYLYPFLQFLHENDIHCSHYRERKQRRGAAAVATCVETLCSAQIQHN
jgi:hypothetical protein